jgi:hypothetical protein
MENIKEQLNIMIRIIITSYLKQELVQILGFFVA